MRPIVLCSLGALLVSCAAGSVERRPAAPPVHVASVASVASGLISAPRLCIGAGSVDAVAPSAFSTEAGGLRADVPGSSGEVAELRFRYRGPILRTVPLANGETRRQLGIRLRAHDTCNLVYVMWRAGDPGGIFVSVKSNPGMRSHHACGANGYVNLRPGWAKRPRTLREGEGRTLRAEIAGTHLRVTADGEPAWEGELPAPALGLAGSAGVRSDNVAFDFELRVDAAADAPCAAVR